MHILDVFARPGWQHLMAALVHTLWQGAALALLMSLILRRISARHPDARYLIALTAQFGLLLAGLVTWSILDYRPSRATTSSAGPIDIGPAAARAGQGATEPTTAMPPHEESDHGTGTAPRWVPIMAVGWLIGVGLMLLRTAGSVWSATRLAHGPRVADSTILAMVDQARTELGVGRLVRVVASGAVHGPAVLGAVWPTLVLPVTALTGLPAETLRLILIHELAHIRRLDYLVNIAQMFVEALLFFNPAVWWIGRQVRLEREACCDAVAVRLTGRPLEYSRSLVDWAGRLRAPVVGVAWTGPSRTSVLLDRIRRVLRPGDRPGASISFSGLILLLVGGPVLVVGLWRGTTAAVSLAAQVLSPTQREARIQAAQAEFVPTPPASGGEVTLKGTIRTANGQPPPREIQITVDSETGPSSRDVAVTAGGTFSIPASSGANWLRVWGTDGFAPTIVGPFPVAAGQTLDGITIVLEPGFPARVRVVDENGQPVADAHVNGGLFFHHSAIYGMTGWFTNAQGIATIPHSARLLYSLVAKRSGFQDGASVNVTPAPGETITITLKHTRPTQGIVVDQKGTPVPGATVQLLARRRVNPGYYNLPDPPLLATTDERGRFVIDTLVNEAVYTLLVRSKNQGITIVRDIEPGQNGLRWTLIPTLTINGTVKRAASDRTTEPLEVYATQRWPGEDDWRNEIPRFGVPVDNQGHFTVGDLLPGEVDLKCQGTTVRVKVERPETAVTIELFPPAPSAPPVEHRRVVLRIVVKDQKAPPSGFIEVFASDSEGGSRRHEPRLPLEKGEASLDAPAPGIITYTSRPMTSYSFDPGSVEVKPGDGPQVAEIPAVPAGAITGVVLEADDQPALQGISIESRSVEVHRNLPKGWYRSKEVEIGAGGRFFISPLPLGDTYVVCASRSHNKQVAGPVKLDGTKPTQHLVIRLSRPVAAEGRVLGPDDRPLEGLPVFLAFDHPFADVSWAPPILTDRAGRFQFDGLSSDFAGAYRASIRVNKDYQPVEVPLRPGGDPVEIRLRRGHVIQGRIVDHATGWPIPGVEMRAIHPGDDLAGDLNTHEAEANTDQQGRFRFSNLPEGHWQLSDKSFLTWVAPPPEPAATFPTDGAKPIEIRVTLPDGSKLKPVAPEGP